MMLSLIISDGLYSCYPFPISFSQILIIPPPSKLNQRQFLSKIIRCVSSLGQVYEWMSKEA